MPQETHGTTFKPTRKGVILALAATFALALGAWYWLFATPSLEKSARRILQCEERSDAGCLADYMLPDEVSAQSVTTPKLERLLREYVAPALGDIIHQAPTELVTPLPEHGSLSILLKWNRQNRAPASLSVGVDATPNGNRSPNLVRTLIFATMLTKYQRSVDEHKILAWIRGMGADAEQLKALGFDGIYDPSTKQVVDWETLRASYIAKAKAHNMTDEREYEVES